MPSKRRSTAHGNDTVARKRQLHNIFVAVSPAPEVNELPIEGERTLGLHWKFEVFLSTSDQILIDRYSQRVASGTRHAAHNDDKKVLALAEHLKEVTYRPMNIGFEVLEIDTGQNPPDATFGMVKDRLSCFQL